MHVLYMKSLPFQVKGALVMNIISTITAAIAIILFSLDYVFEMRYGCYGNGESYSYSDCAMFRRWFQVKH